MGKKKNLDLSVEITFKDGHIETFDSPELAAEATGLSEASIKSRCSREGTGKKDGIYCRWADEKTRRSKLAKKNKSKGNNWELEIINKLKEIGYGGCVSSRSQSKNIDNAKVDIIDVNNELPVYIQAKYLQNSPNYFTIRDECPLKDKPFVICWKKTGADGSPSPGSIAMVDIDFFYELLKIYKND